jgi:hypothetical protein
MAIRLAIIGLAVSLAITYGKLTLNIDRFIDRKKEFIRIYSKNI